MVASALIAAGGSLLGGLFGRSKKVSAGDNSYSHVQGIMRASEKYGFNPLTLLGAVSPMGGTPADNSALGQGIANAALIASDAVSAKRQTAARLNAYQTQNARLQKRLEALTIRSPVPGVYGVARQPSDPEVYGNGAGSGGSGVASSGAVPSGNGGQLGDSAVEVQTQPTSTVYVTPGVNASTEVPEGADLEDIASGIILDGINQAKADGRLPKNWEQPFYEAGRKVAAGVAVALDRTHRGVYYGTRALNPWGSAARANSNNIARQYGADWWRHTPKGAW